MSAASDLAAIITSITGVDIGDLDGDRALAEAGERLAACNLGMLSIANPGGFSWPGHWIAIAEQADGTRVPVAMFGVPSGPLHDAGAVVLASASIVEALVVVPLDLDRPHGVGAYGSAQSSGTVTAIFTAPAAGAPCIAHDARRALVELGLEGDRYATNSGTFSKPGRNGQALTLVAEEALAQARANGADIDDATCRRNVITRGIELEPLIGHCFAIGDATFRATRLAEPCAHLERVTRPGVLRAMVHLGGIRADVLSAGEIRVGDTVRILSD
ncbi:MAG: MOSC domain-containing protein [Gaiellales bacterium]